MSLPDLDINFVDSVPEAERFLSWLGERRPALAVDTETTGTDWTDTVRLVQFGDGQGGWAVPTRDWRGVAAEAMRRLDGPVVMHNSPFDMHKLHNDGYDTPPWHDVHDTLIMSRLKDPHLPAGLKILSSRMFGREAVVGQDLLAQQMRENRWTWATVPDDLPAYWGYGVLDTCLTAIAAERLLPQVPRDVYEREMAVLSVMFGAEQRGMRVDPAYTSDLLQEWRDEAAELKALLQAEGIDNPGSDHQVTLHLKAAGWEPQEFTDTGLPKLDKAVLAELEQQYGAVATPLLRYRRLTKWCSTYLERFLRDRDGNDRIHPDIQTMAARTGRMSIRNPALQTLPSKEASIRNCIIPDEGHVLYAIDFSQIEMRLMAHYSQDQSLMDAVEAEDLHRFCASLAYGVAPEDVTDLQRKVAKNTNFARLYGAGPKKIAATAGVSESDIQGYISAFDRRFPGASQFMQEVETTVKRRIAAEGEAYIYSSGGRKIIGDLDKVYAMLNFTLQGSAADVFKQAVVAVDCAGLGDFIVCPIHDELLFSFPKDEAPGLALQAQEAMQDLTSFRVPLTVEITGPLDRWGEGVD